MIIAKIAAPEALCVWLATKIYHAEIWACLYFGSQAIKSCLKVYLYAIMKSFDYLYESFRLPVCH
jgi:hypothetical protein